MCKSIHRYSHGTVTLIASKTAACIGDQNTGLPLMNTGALRVLDTSQDACRGGKTDYIADITRVKQKGLYIQLPMRFVKINESSHKTCGDSLCRQV